MLFTYLFFMVFSYLISAVLVGLLSQLVYCQ